MNFVKVLGMMLAPTAGVTAQYVVGGLVHLFIGLSYAMVYAVFFGSLSGWSIGTKGVVFGLAITALAFAGMPIMGSMMCGGAANPCAATATANPCNPCNPCAPKETMNPCSPRALSNPCNPCNPSGGAASPYGGLVSLINHVIYGLVLAFLYKARTAAAATALR